MIKRCLDYMFLSAVLVFLVVSIVLVVNTDSLYKSFFNMKMHTESIVHEDYDIECAVVSGDVFGEGSCVCVTDVGNVIPGSSGIIMALSKEEFCDEVQQMPAVERL